jgi:RNA-directed DNA polymerase
LWRERKEPHRGPISPLLANLHYAFDNWMDREYPGCPFERYADDAVIHCNTEAQARNLWAALAERLGSVGLELHPEKTKIVYCKDAKRRGNSEHTSFDFLGYTFRARLVKSRWGLFAGFSPAMSTKAKKAKSKQIREWHLKQRSGSDLSSIAEDINPQVRGWINYYGAFYRSELSFLPWRINEHLVRWAMHKFKRLKNKPKSAWAWLHAVMQREPTLFAHWGLFSTTTGRPVGAG